MAVLCRPGFLAICIAVSSREVSRQLLHGARTACGKRRLSSRRGHGEEIAPFSVGLRKDQISEYEKFEGPDPADWVSRGYIIINVNTRGVGSSGGDAVF